MWLAAHSERNKFNTVLRELALRGRHYRKFNALRAETRRELPSFYCSVHLVIMLIIKKFVCLISIIYLVDGVAGQVEGLTCYSCTDYSFDGSPYSANQCYLLNNDSLPYEETCAQDSAKDKYYCQTRFIWEEGILNEVRRGCVSSLSDEDTSTTEVPDSVKCDINAWRRTECYYHCLTKNCNTLSAGNFKKCNSTCGQELQKGRCDVTSGECICSSGWKGQDCLLSEIATSNKSRSCVQCTSETDELCEVKNESSVCSSNQAFCSFTEIHVFSQGHKHSRLVAKGCSSDAVTNDGCKMNLDYNYRGRGKYICHKTCEEDGCNADLDFSSVEKNSDKSLRCVQCSGVGNCGGNAEPCSPISTHCQSTTSYVYDNNVLNPDSSSYLLLETNRGCATAAIPAQCIDEDLGFNLTKTTCQKTCEENGCDGYSENFKRCKSTCGKELQKGQCDVTSGQCICALGWAGQDCSELSMRNESIRCVQCTSLTEELCEVKNETSACFANQAFCSVKEVLTFGESGKRISRLVSKSCASAAGTYGCKMERDYQSSPIGGPWKYTCHKTCLEDGCNAKADFNSNEKENYDKTLLCVQCNGAHCGSSAAPCPAISTHCQSTVTYVYDNKLSNQEKGLLASRPGNLNMNENYMVLETFRGCATAAIPTQCIDEDLGGNLTKTTCKETCEENGCNEDLPARPKCVQCSAIYKDYYVGNCLTVFPIAQECLYPYQTHCITKNTIGKSGVG